MKRLLHILIVFVILGLSQTGIAQSKLAIDPATKYIRFFPNPAISVINFEFTNGFDKNFSLEIYNFIGKKIFDAHTLTPKISVPLTDFYRGVYIYQLRDRTGRIIESGKFQVTR